MFFSILIITFIFCSIWPCLNSISMLFVFFPISYIFCSINMFVNSSSMSFIINPITVIAISICVDKSSISVCLIIFPISFIFACIFPQLNSFSFPQSFFCPLTMIYCTVVQFIWTSCYYFNIFRAVLFIPYKWTKPFLCFSSSCI